MPSKSLRVVVQEQASLIASLKAANSEKDRVIEALKQANSEREWAFDTLEYALTALEEMTATRRPIVTKRGFTHDGMRLQ